MKRRKREPSFWARPRGTKHLKVTFYARRKRPKRKRARKPKGSDS